MSALTLKLPLRRHLPQHSERAGNGTILDAGNNVVAVLPSDQYHSSELVDQMIAACNERDQLLDTITHLMAARRDSFAMSALQGILAGDPNLSGKATVSSAFAIADSCMDARRPREPYAYTYVHIDGRRDWRMASSRRQPDPGWTETALFE